MIQFRRFKTGPEPHGNGTKGTPAGETDLINLVGGKTYIVGRQNCEIELNSDGSISRKHAKLQMVHPSGNKEIPELKPHLVLEDLGAKHGTFINDIRVNCYEPQLLPIGSRVRFGLQWNVFIVEYTPLVVCCSFIDDREPLTEAIILLGGHILPNFTQDCEFLIMDSLSTINKFLLALMSLKPIVKTQYFVDLLNYFQTNLTPNNRRLKERDYVPLTNEPMMMGSETKCCVDPRRKSLFEGKLFLFSNSSILTSLEQVIKLGKGEVGLLSDVDLSIAKIQDENTILVVSETEDIKAFNGVKKTVLDVYLGKKSRAIEVWQIIMSIFYVDLNTWCNPNKASPPRRKKPNPETTIQLPSAVPVPLQPTKRKPETCGKEPTIASMEFDTPCEIHIKQEPQDDNGTSKRKCLKRQN